MPVDELLENIESGHCSEAFACGTGAIVCPISAIGEADGKEYPLPKVNQMAATLRSALLDIQESRVPDPFGWVIDLRDREALAAFLEK